MEGILTVIMSIVVFGTGIFTILLEYGLFADKSEESADKS